jgi:biopolymer transport protein ExbD
MNLTDSSEGDCRRPRRGVKRMRRHSLKTDMTPMVDLGFLLITFFVVTARLSEPAVVNLNMPHDGPPIELEDSNALTVLLSQNTVHYYHGSWENARAANAVYSTNLNSRSGLREIILQKQRLLDHSLVNGEGRNGLMLLIKATESATYDQVIDALDQALIMNVKKYALVELVPGEAAYLEMNP